MADFPSYAIPTVIVISLLLLAVVLIFALSRCEWLKTSVWSGSSGFSLETRTKQRTQSAKEDHGE